MCIYVDTLHRKTSECLGAFSVKFSANHYFFDINKALAIHVGSTQRYPARLASDLSPTVADEPDWVATVTSQLK
eukprot:g12223.t1